MSPRNHIIARARTGAVVGPAVHTAVGTVVGPAVGAVVRQPRL
ncbi:hypothetical protein [Actinomadura sp. RB99]|nr:hypothetical protein [Actinomadura sp. RB99]